MGAAWHNSVNLWNKMCNSSPPLLTSSLLEDLENSLVRLEAEALIFFLRDMVGVSGFMISPSVGPNSVFSSWEYEWPVQDCLRKIFSSPSLGDFPVGGRASRAGADACLWRPWLPFLSLALGGLSGAWREERLGLGLAVSGVPGWPLLFVDKLGLERVRLRGGAWGYELLGLTSWNEHGDGEIRGSPWSSYPSLSPDLYLPPRWPWLSSSQEPSRLEDSEPPCSKIEDSAKDPWEPAKVSPSVCSWCSLGILLFPARRLEGTDDPSSMQVPCIGATEPRLLVGRRGLGMANKFLPATSSSVKSSFRLWEPSSSPDFVRLGELGDRREYSSRDLLLLWGGTLVWVRPTPLSNEQDFCIVGWTDARLWPRFVSVSSSTYSMRGSLRRPEKLLRSGLRPLSCFLAWNLSRNVMCLADMGESWWEVL